MITDHIKTCDADDICGVIKGDFCGNFRQQYLCECDDPVHFLSAREKEVVL